MSFEDIWALVAQFVVAKSNLTEPWRILGHQEAKRVFDSWQGLPIGQEGFVDLLQGCVPFAVNEFGSYLAVIDSVSYVVFVDSSIHLFQFFGIDVPTVLDGLSVGRAPFGALPHFFCDSPPDVFRERSPRR